MKLVFNELNGIFTSRYVRSVYSNLNYNKFINVFSREKKTHTLANSQGYFPSGVNHRSQCYTHHIVAPLLLVYKSKYPGSGHMSVYCLSRLMVHSYML